MRAAAGVALLAAAALAAGGCGSSSGSAGAGSTDAGSAAVPADVKAPEDASWYLVSGLSTPDWEKSAPTALFQDARMTGNAGCNSYSYPYTITGDAIDIDGRKPGPSTLIGCEGAAAATDSEYRSLLEGGTVTRWSIGTSGLVLADSSGKELLRYAAVSPAGDWSATSVRMPTSVSTLEPGSEITATFADDGTLTGSAGCNTYSATYTVTGSTISISEPASTKKLCEDAVMAQEASYLEQLPKAKEFTGGKDSLTLLHAEGTIVAEFARATP